MLPEDPAEVAIGAQGSPGEARSNITTGTPPAFDVEVWERFIPFADPAPLPPYSQAGVFVGASGSFARDVSLGDCYQAVLYPKGKGQADGTNILGKVTFPCLKDPERGSGRQSFLTQCAERPQLEINRGGTYLRFSFGSAIPVRARVQIGVSPPELDARGLPHFKDPRHIVASAISEKAGLMHDIRLMDELLAASITDHIPLQPGQKLFYIILAWDDLGNWDAVWNSNSALASDGKPAAEEISTKSRSVTVRLDRMTCLDDSDDLSDGEAKFMLQVKGNSGAPQKRNWEWNPMATGSVAKFPKVSPITMAPPDADTGVRVRLEGTEDDSDSPFDDDDFASPQDKDPKSFRELKFPVGEGFEDWHERLVMTSKADPDNDGFAYTAEIVIETAYT